MMRLALIALTVPVALAGCNFGTNSDLIGGGPADAAGVDLSVAVVTGLPCDVERILSTHCHACHGPKPLLGVPTSLVTYEQLAAAAVKPGTYAARSAARMRDTFSRMPPEPASAVPEADIVLFEAWVNAGIPRGSCDGSAPDLGAPDLGGLDLGGLDLGGLDFAINVADLASGPPQQTGLPCDVATALLPCLACHTNPPKGGAPLPLVTRDNLIAMTSGTTVAARALFRMTEVGDTRMPPEPNPPASAQQVMTLQAWVMAGMPRGECVMAGDGGAAKDL